MKKRKRWKRRPGRPRGTLRGGGRGAMNIPPTPELIAKRSALAQGGDIRLCGYPLGVLLARKNITRGQHDAGLTFAALYRLKNGAAFPTSTTLESGGLMPDDLPPEHRRWLRGLKHAEKYNKTKRALLRCGRDVADKVEQVSVFEDLQTAINENNVRDIRRGLRKLQRWFQRGEY